jgi:hypothetical protein
MFTKLYFKFYSPAKFIKYVFQNRKISSFLCWVIEIAHATYDGNRVVNHLKGEHICLSPNTGHFKLTNPDVNLNLRIAEG